MKVLMVNKFLYQKGGAETYVIKLGNYFKEKGNDVQYFGLKNEANILKNEASIYVNNMNFNKINIKNILTPFKLIYSIEAKRKMMKLLKQFKPDLIILNNIEYHLTPSIILAIAKYKKYNSKAKLFYVAHDYQLICPSHGLFDTNINICEKCLEGKFSHCFKTKCLKNSRVKSLIGTLDSYYWKKRKVYKYVDKIICPSHFLKQKLDTQKEFRNKTIAIHNFVDNMKREQYQKEDYILYFGKICKDKGSETLLEVAKKLPNIKFVFAGYGPLEEKIKEVSNAEYIGFKSGKELKEIIAKAKLSIYPSEWYENCPFSVIESQMLGTPVIGSNMGGIPELIEIGKTGEIFERKNQQDLKAKIESLWYDKDKLNRYSKNCDEMECETLETYYEKLIDIYKKLCRIKKYIIESMVDNMKLIEVGTGYTSIPANMGAATEIVVEELVKVFDKDNVNYEIFDIKDENRKKNNYKIKEINVPKIFRGKDVSLGIKHKIKRIIYSISLANALKKEIKNSNEKIFIHFHNQYNMFFYLKLVPKKLKKKAVTAYTVHSNIWNGNWDSIKNEVKKKYFQEVYCIKNADKVFVLNEITKNHFIKQFNINSEKIIHIDNGANIDIYQPNENYENKDIIFFQCGSVCDRKNQLEAIKMLTKYLKENKNIKYMYAGGIIDQEYKQKIDEYVKENSLEDQIKYVGEVTPGEELSKYYKQAKAFIFPSKAEAFGLALLEAMASGLPVLMNNIYIYRESLNNVISFYEDEKSFDDIMKNKILNESERLKLAKLSRQVIEKEYSWNIIAHRYLQELGFEHKV